MSSEFLSSKNFKSRLITGILLGAIAIASLLTPDAFAFRLLFLFVASMAVIELHEAYIALIYQKLVFIDDRPLLVEYVALVVSVYAFFRLSRTDILLVLIGAIAADTLAYFSGSAMHGLIFKKRPFPTVSPKKSWEGIIGGSIGCVLVLLGFILGFKITDGAYIVFALLCPIVAIFGDFYASLCKRLLCIKDSNECIMNGNQKGLKLVEKLTAGHGGFLDRIDSISMVACLMLFIKITTT